MEKIKVKGLIYCAGWIFAVWGILVALKGFWDAFFGEPEANLYSPQKWEFISQKQWLTWSGFEVTYGVLCVVAGYLLWKFARFLPDYFERKAK